MELTTDSPIIGTPSDAKIKLFKHQQAMLYKCLTIEKGGNDFGVICDPAGVGKTFVILSLILSDKIISKKSTNIVFVPPNICNQWLNEIEKFCGDNLKVKLINDYETISDILLWGDLRDDTIKNYDILLSTILYYDTLVSTLKQNKEIFIKRIIFDEIDTVDNMIQAFSFKETNLCNQDNDYIINESILLEQEEQPLVEYSSDIANRQINQITWFISASFYNVIDPKNGYTYGNKNIPITKLQNIICKCSGKFIEQSMVKLETPLVHLVKCKSIGDIFQSCLSTRQLDYINSMSYSQIKNEVTGVVANNGLQSIKNIIENTMYIIKTNTEYINSFIGKTVNESVSQYIRKAKEKIDFNTKLLSLFHGEICKNKCSNLYECLISKLDEMDNNHQVSSKENKLKDTIRNIKPTDKYIIFSDYSNSFKFIREYLDEYSINYKDIQAGNVSDIAKAIDSYKQGDTSVLIINSSSQGVGLNLENTTDIIMIHRTNETLYNQMIGRAQRPGRTSRLTIHKFYNENEDI